MAHHVLIVEDEAITAIDIKKKLEYWGYQITGIAHSGKEALKLTRELHPDIILMDIVLRGDMDGIETSKQIKNQFDIPIIYLTAHSEDKVMEKAKYTEPYGYLIKPLDDQELRFALESAIYKHQLDKKLKKVNRALRMISDCNQAIVRISNQDILLNKLCHLIVDEGGYKLAWVGMANYDEFKSVKPIAQYGFNEGYLDSLKVSWGDNKYGKSPIGKSIRNSKIFLSRNIPEDPDFIPWRERAVKRGYNSSAALPLFVDDAVIGSLNIYSDEVDAFDSEELELLNELAGDISFYLESQKIKKERYDFFNELKNNEKRLKKIIDSAPFGAHSYEIINEDLIFIGYNNAADQILKIDHQPLLHLPIQDAFPGLTGTRLPEIYYNIALEGGEYQEERFEYEEGDIIGIFDINVVHTGKNKAAVFFKDITESRKTQMALEESEKKYRNIVETAHEGIWSMDKNFVTTFVNPQMADMLGYKAEEMIGRNVTSFMFKDELEDHDSLMENRLKGFSDRYQRKFRKKDGSPLWSIVSATALLDDENNFNGSFAMVTDISYQKEYEEKMISALEEKELLLSEIHHRVKNNMQIIISLLNLQNPHLKDDKDRELFIESQNRVKSLALIHEKLYRSKDLARIDFAEYIRDLVYYLFYTYISNPESIKLNFILEKLNLNIETGIPCGIIINELVTNSLKHAFPSKRKGLITIELYPEKEDYVLIIRDNGIGFPEDIYFRNTKTLGMRLVINLVNQINGKIYMDQNSGTEFKIIFKELVYQKRV